MGNKIDNTKHAKRQNLKSIIQFKFKWVPYKFDITLSIRGGINGPGELQFPTSALRRKHHN